MLISVQTKKCSQSKVQELIKQIRKEQILIVREVYKSKKSCFFKEIKGYSHNIYFEWNVKDKLAIVLKGFEEIPQKFKTDSFRDYETENSVISAKDFTEYKLKAIEVRENHLKKERL